jgi:AraC-like DNA-binding protein
MSNAQKTFNSAHLQDRRRFDHWSTLHTHLVWAYDKALEAPTKRSSSWDYTSYPIPVWFIRKGWIKLHLETGTETYTPGTWVFPPQGSGRQEIAPNTHLISIRFISNWPNGAHLFARERTLTFSENELPAFTQATQQLIRAINNEHIPPLPLEIEGSFSQYLRIQPAFHTWLYAYYETITSQGIPPVTPSHLHEKTRIALLILQNHAIHEPFREKDLATKIGVSISQLNKLFRKDLGFTPSAYWNKRRLLAAYSELSQNSSIKSIAYTLGFSSPSNFSRWFQGLAGISPKEYRNKRDEPGI